MCILASDSIDVIIKFPFDWNVMQNSSDHLGIGREGTSVLKVLGMMVRDK